MLSSALLVVMSVALAVCQRPFFAGKQPIGYPTTTTTTTKSNLADRFGEDDVTTTTQRLPIEANGDKDLVDRLSKLPLDKQPFWLINWQALEANRENPQSYPIRPNPFLQTIVPTSNTNAVNRNSELSNTGTNTNIEASSAVVNNPGVNTELKTNDGIKKMNRRNAETPNEDKLNSAAKNIRTNLPDGVKEIVESIFAKKTDTVNSSDDLKNNEYSTYNIQY